VKITNLNKKERKKIKGVILWSKLTTNRPDVQALETAEI